MAYITDSIKQSFKKVEEWLQKEYTQLHTGRATPTLLDSIMVESYGQLMPIRNVGSINIEDPRTLRVVPWDKTVIKDIEKSLQVANLGFSVVVDGEGLRVIMPILTTENRQKLVKVLKEKLEDARISVRKEREAIMDDIKQNEKDGLLSEDDKFRAQEEVQKLVDDTNKNLESIFSKKEEDVMTV